MNGLKAAGFSYEKAFNAISVAGAFLLCVGIAAWLLTIYGRGPAGIAFLLLAPIILLGQGIHTIVPSNIALGFSLFLWTIVLRNSKRWLWLVVPLTFIILSTHTIGKLYSSIALAIALVHWRPLARRKKFILAACATLLLLAFALPVFIHQPELNTDLSRFFPGSRDYLNELLSSLGPTMLSVDFWYEPLKGWAGTILLISLLLLVRFKNRRAFILMAASLAGLLALSMLYVDPFFGALVFERAWVPAAIFLTGAIGSATWTLLRHLAVHGARLIRYLQSRHTSRMPAIRLISYVGLLLTFHSVFASYYPYFLFHYDLTLNNKIQRGNVRFDSSQPALLQELGYEGSNRVLYTDELSLYYYLTYGALDFGAVYSPTIIKQEEKQAIAGVDFLVANNPIFYVQNDSTNQVSLDDNAFLEIVPRDQADLDSFDIFLVHQGAPVSIRVIWSTGDKASTSELLLKNGANGWFSFHQTEFKAEKLTISLIGDRQVSIRGIHFDPATPTNWPWSTGVMMELVPSVGDPIHWEVSTQVLARGLPLSVEVLDDDGYTILAKVTPLD